MNIPIGGGIPMKPAGFPEKPGIKGIVGSWFIKKSFVLILVRVSLS